MRVVEFSLYFPFYWRLHSWQPGAHERGKHGWTQLWSEWWKRLWLLQVVHHSKVTPLTSPGKLSLRKDEWFLCTSHFSLFFCGGGCGLETSGAHSVWKGVHQCHCVSHRIKGCEQWCTTDAALFRCGPSEGERRTSPKHPYVHSLPSSWFVRAFQWAVTACQAINYHTSSPSGFASIQDHPPNPLAGLVCLFRKVLRFTE